MKKLSLTVILGTCLIIMAFCSNSYADGPQKHQGFYLRMQFGFADTITKATGYSTISDMEVSGLAGVFNLDIGGAIRENLILHGRIGGITISDPNIKIDNTENTASGTTSTISDLGIGVTYYFMPSNVYIGGSINMAENSIDIGNVEVGASETGYGLFLNIGKEWWVSDNWGLGVAMFGYNGRVPDKIEGNLKNSSYGLLFSATYN